MNQLHTSPTDATERHRGLHLADNPDEGQQAPSKASGIIYQAAALAAALLMLATVV
jgi:hypothetical protein